MGHQIGVGALFDDAARIHHDNPVGPLNRGQTVSDDEGRATGHGIMQGLLNQTLIFGVQSAGGLIEQEHGRIAHQGPGNSQPLLLTTRKGLGPFTDGGVIALRQGADKAVNLGGT